MTALQILQSIGLSFGPVLALSLIGFFWAAKSKAPRLPRILRTISIFWIGAFVVIWTCLIIIDKTCSGNADKGYHNCSFFPQTIANNITELLVTGFIAAILSMSLLFVVSAWVEYHVRR